MFEQKNVVITYGTFDLFHIGHVNILKRAREEGDFLIVAVSTDDFNSIKGKKSIIPYDQRVKVLESVKYVDLVIPEEGWGQKESDIDKYNVKTFVMGHDWKGKFDELSSKCRVIYLERTDGISTTEIKQSLSILQEVDIKKMMQAVEILQQITKDLR